MEDESMTGKRVVRYIRVSRSDQKPGLQADESLELIKNRGWNLTETFIDQGFSGAKDRRPALDQMMGAARRRSFDILVVWRADRLFRSLRHMINALAELEALGIAFVSVTEPFDTTTPQGRLLVHLVASFAEFERGAMSLAMLKVGGGSDLSTQPC
jgi:site-specific DNA recombinase